MSLLEQDTTRKGQVNKKVRQIEFDVGNNEEYEMEVIWESAVYVRESKSGYLSDLYYLISWKGYPKEENTCKPASVVQHLRKLICLFHKDHLDKPTATSSTIDTTPTMARPTVKPIEPLKQKQG